MYLEDNVHELLWDPFKINFGDEIVEVNFGKLVCHSTFDTFLKKKKRLSEGLSRYNRFLWFCVKQHKFLTD